jgi:hypothetical protein
VTPTITATRTVTETPKIPDGGACATPSQCQSGFCVEGICCDTACNLPMQTCDSPPGRCTGLAAPAPALSNAGLLIGFAVLALVGALALVARRRSQP